MAEYIHSDPKKVQLNDSIFPFLAGFQRFPYYKADSPMLCPKYGAFTGYKIGLTLNDHASLVPCIITISIPEDARRSSAYSNKCRCDKAKVLDIRTFGGREVKSAISQYDHSFVYEINKEVSAPDFDENRWHECAPGIHFFMSEKEALEYFNW